MRTRIKFLNMSLLLSGLAFLVGCHKAPAPGSSVTNAPPALDPVRVARGAEVYRQNCASCHGDRAQGALNWQKPGPDGKYLPPPLNGSAHSWHHPFAQHMQTIQHGTLRLGGSMPPWKDKLSDADIEAVILYFQSLWPAEIYLAWRDIDSRARKESAR
jgi:mono/diheme cytochrome c family protein